MTFPLKAQGTLPHPLLRMSHVPHIPLLPLNLSREVPIRMLIIKFAFLVNLFHIDFITRPA